MYARICVALLGALLAVGPAGAQDGTLTHSESEGILPEGAVACFGTGHTDNHYYRTFTICEDPFSLTDEIEIVSVEFGCISDPAEGFETQPIEVNIYEDTSANEPDLLSLSLIGGETFDVEPLAGDLFLATFGTPIAVPCDITIVVEVFSPNGEGVAPGTGQPDHLFAMGHNEEGESSPSYLWAPECGLGTIVPANDIAFSIGAGEQQYVMNVNYDIAGSCPCAGPGNDCQLALIGGYEYQYVNSTDYSNAPDSDIADDLPPTVDVISISGVPDLVADLDCTVNITHTFIGDLDVELESPIGILVQLHNEGGLNLNNIRATYDDSARPTGRPFGAGDRMQPSGPGEMADFAASDISGDWTLTVTDLAAGDDGVLDDWTLHFTAATLIPNDTGESVTTVIDVPFADFNDLRDLDVRLVLDHDLPADLTISLESPAGTSVTLAAGDLPAGPDIDARVSDVGGECDGYGTFETSGPGSLADFDGEALSGSWTLNALDDSGATTDGALLGWRMMVAPEPCDEPVELLVESDCAANAVYLNWTIPDGVTYADIELRRNGETLATLGGTETFYEDLAPAVGEYTYLVIGNCEPGRGGESMTIFHTTCCPVDALAAASLCDEGDVSITWSNPTGAVYVEHNIFRDGVVIAMALKPETDEYFDVAVTAGTHVYVVESVCEGILGSNSASFTLQHAPFTGQTDLVWAPAGLGTDSFGAVDSGAAVMAALEANGRKALRIPSLDYSCMPDGSEFTNLWVCLGTFPDNTALTDVEGDLLAGFATGDSGLDDTIDHAPVAVFLEGGDIWGFDDPNSFGAYDGCEFGVADGDDTLEGLNGLAYGDLDLSGFAGVGYAQDQAGPEYTDNLLPTGTTGGVELDLGGDDAGPIWVDDETGGGDGYNVGVLYQAVFTIAGEEVRGRVICQSFEFGGLGSPAQRTDVMALYVEAMSVPRVPVADFSADPLEGPAPLMVAFTDLSTGSPTSWLWDFGDGATSTEQNPTHEFTEDGTFDVTLVATNSGGSGSLTREDYITVGGAALFRRGDSDGNGSVQALLDALHLLVYFFNDGPAPPCLDAADADNNGVISGLLDALLLLNWQFLSGPAPPSPGPTTCGPDPAGTSVGCESPPAACN